MTLCLNLNQCFVDLSALLEDEPPPVFSDIHLPIRAASLILLQNNVPTA